MSTPTSELSGRAALVAACLCLAGCGEGWLAGLHGGVAPAPTDITVTTDQIVVTGPKGFCIDPTATRDTADSSFVLLGNCAAIANTRRAGQPATPAVLTATISAETNEGRLADSLDELDRFFRSDAGKTLLSRSGDPSSVTILETLRTSDVFLLHAEDKSAATIADVQPDYWRAYMDVGPRLATLSVLALNERSLSRAESLSVLQSFIDAVQGANVRPDAAPLDAADTVAATPPEPQDSWWPRSGLWNVGIFRRIFDEG